jgi:hypothetical protein
VGLPCALIGLFVIVTDDAHKEAAADDRNEKSAYC